MSTWFGIYQFCLFLTVLDQLILIFHILQVTVTILVVGLSEHMFGHIISFAAHFCISCHTLLGQNGGEGSDFRPIAAKLLERPHVPSPVSGTLTWVIFHAWPSPLWQCFFVCCSNLFIYLLDWLACSCCTSDTSCLFHTLCWAAKRSPEQLAWAATPQGVAAAEE